MDVISWSDTMRIGIPELDHEHRKLIKYVNQIYQLDCPQNECSSEIKALLKKLIDYTNYHSMHEEEVMSRYQYPGFVEHKEQHKKLESSMRLQIEKATNQEDSFSIGELKTFLISWLKNHIIKEDTQFNYHLKRMLNSDLKERS